MNDSALVAGGHIYWRDIEATPVLVGLYGHP